MSWAIFHCQVVKELRDLVERAGPEESGWVPKPGAVRLQFHRATMREGFQMVVGVENWAVKMGKDLGAL